MIIQMCRRLVLLQVRREALAKATAVVEKDVIDKKVSAPIVYRCSRGCGFTSNSPGGVRGHKKMCPNLTNEERIAAGYKPIECAPAASSSSSKTTFLCPRGCGFAALTAGGLGGHYKGCPVILQQSPAQASKPTGAPAPASVPSPVQGLEPQISGDVPSERRQPKRWSCSQCTYMNVDSKEQCEICYNERRPNVRVHDRKHAPPEANTRNSTGSQASICEHAAPRANCNRCRGAPNKVAGATPGPHNAGDRQSKVVFRHGWECEQCSGGVSVIDGFAILDFECTTDDDLYLNTP